MGIYHICFFNWKSQNPLDLCLLAFILKVAYVVAFLDIKEGACNALS